MIYHKEPLDIIRKFTKTRFVDIKLKESSTTVLKARLQSSEKGLFLSFNRHKTRQHLRVGNFVKKLWASGPSKWDNFIIERTFIESEKDKTTKGSADIAYTKGYKKRTPYYYRVILPVQTPVIFHYKVEETFFISDQTRSRTGLRAQFGDETLLLCSHRSESGPFISVESDVKQPWESFSKKVAALLCALGYLTSYLPGGGTYYFAYKDSGMVSPDFFFYLQQRESMQHGYAPIHSNPHNLLHGERKPLAQYYYGRNLLRVLNQTEFNRLVKLCYENEGFSKILYVLMEVMSGSIQVMAGQLAILLELIADVFLTDFDLDFRPIKSSVIETSLKAGYKKVLEEYKSSISHDDYDSLIGKINSINQPANAKRLRKPFEILNIFLSKNDKAVIDARNDFLHGRSASLKKHSKMPEAPNGWRNDYYVSMRLYTLISMLILKWVGYDNYVLNQPVIHRDICQLSLKERAYRKIPSKKPMVKSKTTSK